MKQQFLFLLLCLGLVSCINDLEEVDRLFEATDPGQEVARDVEVTYSDSARVRVIITGPKLIRHLDKVNPRDEFSEGLHVDFLDEHGQVESTLDAQVGIRYPREHKVIVRDTANQVLLTSIRGETLETSELIWEEKEGTVWTDKFVKITKPEEIIFAYGFRAKQDFSEYTLLSVVAKMKVEDLESDFKN